jgi:hypothetical protein
MEYTGKKIPKVMHGRTINTGRCCYSTRQRVPRPTLPSQINGTKGTPLQPVISKSIANTSKTFIILKPLDYFIEDTDTKNPSLVSQGSLKPEEPRLQTPQVKASVRD